MSNRTRIWSTRMGAIGIVLILVALFLPGPPPRTDDSVGHLVALFADKRRLFIVDTYLAALGAIAFLWFLAPLHDFLSRRGRGLATLAVLGGALAVVLILVGVAITTGLVVNAAVIGDGALVRAFADTTNVLIELAKFPLATMICAVLAGAAPDALPGSARPAGLTCAALLIVSALPPFLFYRGILQFGGGIEVLATLPAALWVIWLSLFLAGSQSAATSEPVS